jgi:hypothetical protein
VRPGINTETLERATTSVIPTDVSLGLMVGVTEAGPEVPTSDNILHNTDEYNTVYAPSGQSFTAGQRMLYSVEEFFRQGGASLVVSRVTGPASVPASVDVLDAADGVVLEVSAKGDGEWGNDLDVRIDLTADNPDIPANNYRINVVRRADDQLLEVSPDLGDTDSAITWAKTDSQNISIDGGVSVQLPDSATYSLTGGLNDITNITNADWQTAIDALGRNLGPGLLMLPGVTTDALHKYAATAAEPMGRVYLEDLPDTDDEATLIAAVKATTNSDGKRSRFSGAFAPWLIVPGQTSNAVRKVPPSVAVAGRFSANMALGMSANEPAAADNGILSRVLDFTQTWSDEQRENLNKNGVNVLMDVYGTPKIYGWRTTADPVNDKLWIALSNSLLHRQIIALSNVVMERFVFRQVNTSLMSRFGAALVGHVCMPLYEQGALLGDTPQEAYKVDSGTNVNTPEVIENNELRAVISVRMAPFGEKLTVYLVKYAVNEAIPA